jgi:DNA repair protein RadC
MSAESSTASATRPACPAAVLAWPPFGQHVSQVLDDKHADRWRVRCWCASIMPPLADLTAQAADRPRERLWHHGVLTLGDAELLAIVLGTGVRARPALAVATDLLVAAGGIAPLSRASPRELALTSGVGTARATQIAAAFELGRRAITQVQRRATLSHADDIFRICEPRVAGLAQEVFLVIGMDIRNGLLDVVEVSRGSANEVVVHPREVFRPLIRMAAAGGVVVHNHPSGDPTPSLQDIELTHRLRAAGHLLGIPLIDHVIAGDRTFRSVAEHLGPEF